MNRPLFKYNLSLDVSGLSYADKANLMQELDLMGYYPTVVGVEIKPQKTSFILTNILGGYKTSDSPWANPSYLFFTLPSQWQEALEALKAEL